MRLLVCLLEAFLFSVCLNAQLLNTARHDGTKQTGRMVSTGTKFFHIESSFTIGHCCSYNVGIEGHDIHGNHLFRTNFKTETIVERMDLCLTADKHIIAFSGSFIHDCDLGTNIYTVSKIDTTGQKLWTFDVNNKVTTIVPLNDSGFCIVFRDGVVQRYYSSGSSHSSFTLTGGQYHSGTQLANGNLLLSCSTGTVSRLQLVSPAGTMVKDTIAPNTLTQIYESSDGSIFGLHNMQIQRYHPALFATASTTSSQQLTVNCIFLRNDTVFGAGINNAGMLTIRAYDWSLTPLHTINSNAKAAVPTGITVGANNQINVITTGEAAFKPAYTYSGLFLTHISSSSLTLTKDVGVVAIPEITIQGPLHIPNQFVVSATITVKNFGTEPVSNFFLNDFNLVSGTANCFLGINRQFTETIVPGGTANISTGTLIIGVQVFSPFPGKIPLCFHTTLPDGVADMNITNDFICMQIDPPTDVHEISIDKGPEIFPIPTSDILHITSIKSPAEFILFNPDGEEIYHLKSDGPQTQLSVKDFPSGLYFLRILSSEPCVKKIIISR